MADLALFEPQFQGVRVVAADAGVEALDVLELGVVGLALVLVAAFSLGAVHRGARRQVVDVRKAQVPADGIVVSQIGFRDGLVYRGLRRAALVALQAARFRPEAGDLRAGGERDAGQRGRDRIVAGIALDHRPNRRRLVHLAGLAPIRADEILEARRAVAPGAVRRDLRRVGFVPVVEGQGRLVGVRGTGPGFFIGDHWHHRRGGHFDDLGDRDLPSDLDRHFFDFRGGRSAGG